MAYIIFQSNFRNSLLEEAVNTTNGINKIRLVYKKINGEYESTESKSITGLNPDNGNVYQDNEVVFNIDSGSTVEHFILSNDSNDYIVYYFDSVYVFNSSGTISVKNTKLSIPING